MEAEGGITVRSIHRWLDRHYPKAGVCERCHRSANRTEHAFQKHPEPYTKNRSDYLELCSQCHIEEHAAALPKEARECARCGLSFQAKRKTSKYCSDRCKQGALRDRRSGRNVTSEEYVTLDANPERFRLFRLCDCPTCEGKGKAVPASTVEGATVGYLDRCPDCRGEGRIRQEIATCATPEAVGVAIVTLAREGEWDECPFGLLDSEGEKGKRWLVLPWTPSARNVTDAARTLAKSKKYVS